MTTDVKSEDYFIVEATLKEVKAYDGSVLTREDEVRWLSMSDGYPSFSRNAKDAHRFASQPTKKFIASWDGMPWYCRMKSTRIFRVKRETITTIEETVKQV
jgi:hypothetical protein